MVSASVANNNIHTNTRRTTTTTTATSSSLSRPDKDSYSKILKQQPQQQLSQQLQEEQFQLETAPPPPSSPRANTTPCGASMNLSEHSHTKTKNPWTIGDHQCYSGYQRRSSQPAMTTTVSDARNNCSTAETTASTRSISPPSQGYQPPQRDARWSPVGKQKQPLSSDPNSSVVVTLRSRSPTEQTSGNYNYQQQQKLLTPNSVPSKKKKWVPPANMNLGMVPAAFRTPQSHRRKYESDSSEGRQGLPNAVPDLFGGSACGDTNTTNTSSPGEERKVLVSPARLKVQWPPPKPSSNSPASMKLRLKEEFQFDLLDGQVAEQKKFYSKSNSGGDRRANNLKQTNNATQKQEQQAQDSVAQKLEQQVQDAIPRTSFRNGGTVDHEAIPRRSSRGEGEKLKRRITITSVSQKLPDHALEAIPRHSHSSMQPYVSKSNPHRLHHRRRSTTMIKMQSEPALDISPTVPVKDRKSVFERVSNSRIDLLVEGDDGDPDGINKIDSSSASFTEDDQQDDQRIQEKDEELQQQDFQEEEEEEFHEDQELQINQELPEKQDEDDEDEDEEVDLVGAINEIGGRGVVLELPVYYSSLEDEDLTDSCAESDANSFIRYAPVKRTSYRIRYGGPISVPRLGLDDRFGSSTKNTPKNDGAPFRPTRTLDTAPCRPLRPRSSLDHDRHNRDEEDRIDEEVCRADVWITPMYNGQTTREESMWKVKRVWGNSALDPDQNMKEGSDGREVDRDLEHSVPNNQLLNKIKTLVGAETASPTPKDGVPKMPKRNWHVKKFVEDYYGEVEDSEGEVSMDEERFSVSIDRFAEEAMEEARQAEAADKPPNLPIKRDSGKSKKSKQLGIWDTPVSGLDPSRKKKRRKRRKAKKGKQPSSDESLEVRSKDKATVSSDAAMIASLEPDTVANTEDDDAEHEKSSSASINPQQPCIEQALVINPGSSDLELDDDVEQQKSENAEAKSEQGERDDGVEQEIDAKQHIDDPGVVPEQEINSEHHDDKNVCSQEEVGAVDLDDEKRAMSEVEDTGTDINPGHEIDDRAKIGEKDLSVSSEEIIDEDIIDVAPEKDIVKLKNGRKAEKSGVADQQVKDVRQPQSRKHMSVEEPEMQTEGQITNLVHAKPDKSDTSRLSPVVAASVPRKRDQGRVGKYNVAGAFRPMFSSEAPPSKPGVARNFRRRGGSALEKSPEKSTGSDSDSDSDAYDPVKRSELADRQSHSPRRPRHGGKKGRFPVDPLSKLPRQALRRDNNGSERGGKESAVREAFESAEPYRSVLGQPSSKPRKEQKKQAKIESDDSSFTESDSDSETSVTEQEKDVIPVMPKSGRSWMIRGVARGSGHNEPKETSESEVSSDLDSDSEEESAIEKASDGKPDLPRQAPVMPMSGRSWIIRGVTRGSGAMGPIARASVARASAKVMPKDASVSNVSSDSDSSFDDESVTELEKEDTGDSDLDSDSDSDTAISSVVIEKMIQEDAIREAAQNQELGAKTSSGRREPPMRPVKAQSARPLVRGNDSWRLVKAQSVGRIPVRNRRESDSPSEMTDSDSDTESTTEREIESENLKDDSAQKAASRNAAWLHEEPSALRPLKYKLPRTFAAEEPSKNVQSMSSRNISRGKGDLGSGNCSPLTRPSNQHAAKNNKEDNSKLKSNSKMDKENGTTKRLPRQE